MSSSCTLMLVDMDSNFPATVWVTANQVRVDVNSTTNSPAYYFWSGPVGVVSLSVVVFLPHPSDGWAITVYDSSANQSGHAAFGNWFPPNGC